MNGYGRTQPSHAAVAQAVAAADTGPGIELAARTRQPGFVPLVQEHYHLVCLKSVLEQPAAQALLQVLRSPPWQAELAAMAGHAPAGSGEVLSMRQVLPWLGFRKKSVIVLANRAQHATIFIALVP